MEIISIGHAPNAGFSVHIRGRQATAAKTRIAENDKKSVTISRVVKSSYLQPQVSREISHGVDIDTASDTTLAPLAKIDTSSGI